MFMIQIEKDCVHAINAVVLIFIIDNNLGTAKFSFEIG